MISFATTLEDAKLIGQIVRRAEHLAIDAKISFDRMSMNMDLTACHANGNPLKLQLLLEADNFNFSHDVFGISNHINRKTGLLEDCFSPRFSC